MSVEKTPAIRVQIEDIKDYISSDKKSGSLITDLISGIWHQIASFITLFTSWKKMPVSDGDRTYKYVVTKQQYSDLHKKISKCAKDKLQLEETEKNTYLRTSQEFADSVKDHFGIDLPIPKDKNSAFYKLIVQEIPKKQPLINLHEQSLSELNCQKANLLMLQEKFTDQLADKMDEFNEFCKEHPKYLQVETRNLTQKIEENQKDIDKVSQSITANKKNLSNLKDLNEDILTNELVSLKNNYSKSIAENKEFSEKDNKRLLEISKSLADIGKISQLEKNIEQSENKLEGLGENQVSIGNKLFLLKSYSTDNKSSKKAITTSNISEASAKLSEFYNSTNTLKTEKEKLTQLIADIDTKKENVTEEISTLANRVTLEPDFQDKKERLHKFVNFVLDAKTNPKHLANKDLQKEITNFMADPLLGETIAQLAANKPLEAQ